MPGANTSTTLSAQYQSFFVRTLMQEIEQLTILSQFANKVPVPKNSGSKNVSLFRWGPPSIAGISALSEGPVIPTPQGTPANGRQLTLLRINKDLAQYGETYWLSDVSRMTELFNSLKQAVKTAGQDMGLWVDSVMRNVLIGSNLLTSGSSIGTAIESAIDNNDAINTAANAGTSPNTGGINAYGNPATLNISGTLTQSFQALNSALTAADTVASASALLDLATRLRVNRAPELPGGGYVYVTSPQVARDLMRDADWLTASNYGSNAGKPMYRGEVGSFYGVKVVQQTNPFICRRVSADTDQFVFSEAGTNGLAAGSKIYASIMLGADAFGIPQLSGDNAVKPEVIINDRPDKADPLNQYATVGVKTYFTALRMAAGNTASSGNPVWYLVHRTKSNFAS